MKKHILILIVLISGCCSYDKNDLEFSNEELAHFSNYKIGDTIYFQSNLANIDTIAIAAIKTEKQEKCGGVGQVPINAKWIQAQHLPIDNWHGISQAGHKVDIVYQSLLSIAKAPIEKKINYTINFQDFSSANTSLGEIHKDSLKLNDISFSDYYVIQHSNPEKVKDARNIEIAYWTDKYGLTAYKNKGGEIWTIKKP